MPRTIPPSALCALLSSTLFSSCESTETTNTDNHSHNHVDITNVIFTQRSGNCADYDNRYEASVRDEKENKNFTLDVTITANNHDCTLVSNNIPNHDFNDNTAHFASKVSEVGKQFSISQSPQIANAPTNITQRYYDGVMLNGVVIDLLSAGCYKPTDSMADQDGNTPIGCNDSSNWLLDPLSSDSSFGADAHNAHTQPDGSYHYHGNPNAMFDSNPGSDGSPVIGFAADGFPIYGSYFYDGSTVRKARSSYQLKDGSRGTQSDTNPGGNYSGTYVNDYEYVESSGDLDMCNGMSIDGQYGYYVTDSYPWILKCLSGTVNESFRK